ncbi:MAG: TonB-dependent receptor [Chloroflexia bacterium]|nr:TonB-dependent receptor [Chloroflexia bacterium]
MRTKILLLLITMPFFQILKAQSSLTGNVLDGNDKPIFFATAVLYNQSDSTIAKSTSTGEDGKFKIENIKPGKYYLELRFLGYQNKRITELEFPKDNDSSYPIKMEQETNQLSEVEVTGKKPLLEQESDRLVVNVADNLTGNNNNLMDVMKKVPGVIVIGDKISLAGSSNLTILIDGKTTKYMDVESLLKDIPGDNVEKVEVIHQPGAEFDAAGSGPIINIILKKNKLFGTFGSVNTGFSMGDSWRYFTNASFTQYQGNVNINGSVGYRNSEYRSLMDVDRYNFDDLYDQTSQNLDSWETYRGNLNIDWNIDKRHRAGVQSRFTSYDSDD